MHGGILVQALVYLAAGVVSVPIAKRLGLGSVLGYLIAGAVIGPFALKLVGQQAEIGAFAEFGVVILLFLIGLEVKPALLWSMRKAIFGLGGAQVLATAAAIAAATVLVGMPWKTATAVGLVLAMSSTAIVLQTLDERGLRQGPVGRAAFGVLLLQDLSVIPLFALLPLLASAPARLTSTAQQAHTSLVSDLPAWLQTLAVLSAVAAVVGIGRYLVRPVFRFIAQARLREIFTGAALLIVVGVAALMQMVGLSPALGAFLAGVVLAESEFRRELETDIEPFRGLLLGLFFITVGASIDFGLVMQAPWLLLGIVLGLMILKFAVMFGLALAGGASLRAAAAIGVALAQGGEFAFVLLTFTVGAGVIDARLAALLTAAVAVSMALSPLSVVLYERIEALIDAKKPDAPKPEDPTFDNEEPDIIIAGFGRFGQIVGRLLTANGFSSTVLDASIEQIELLRRFGRPVHYGDATRLDLLRAAGAERAKMLIVAIDDAGKTSELVRTAREAFPNLIILARAFDRRHAYDLLANGADAAERETFESALKMGTIALKRLGFRAHRAWRAAAYFRRHDRRQFEQLKPVWGQEEAYLLASRDAAETMTRLLAADLARMKPDAEGGWAEDEADEAFEEEREQEARG